MFLICWAAWIYGAAIFARIILSWFPIQPDSPVAPVVSALYAVTEPVLGPLRRALPPVPLGGMALDLSATIVSFVIFLLLIPLFC